MVVKVMKLFPDALPPRRASDGAVGYDVYAYHVLDKKSKNHAGDLPVEILPGDSVLLGIGISMAVPPLVDCQMRPRSGLANKYDVELSNSPGTIDPDFRGEAGVLLRNRGKESFTVDHRMRVAQLIFTTVHLPHMEEVEVLPATFRGSGGFGSTGLHEISRGDAGYLEEEARWDAYFMKCAVGAASLSDCLRGAKRHVSGSFLKNPDGSYEGATRRFGCIIVKAGTIICQGFNRRTMECSEECGCVREREGIPSGTQNDRGCLHAEQVALQNHALTGGPSLKGATLYVNAEPCPMCAKLLLACGIETVVVPRGVYPSNGLNLLAEAGIEVRQI